jgi:hypothetical protein
MLYRFREQVKQWSLQCKAYHQSQHQLEQSALQYTRQRHQIIHTRHMQTTFTKDNPTSDDWDDGCSNVSDRDLVVFVADFLTNVDQSTKMDLRYTWTAQDIDLIWTTFAKSRDKTPYNKCRVLLGCILLVLKWSQDPCMRIATKSYWSCIPVPLCLCLTSSQIGVVEAHVFVYHLQCHPFELSKI